jgi:hypothetical protein
LNSVTPIWRQAWIADRKIAGQAGFFPPQGGPSRKSEPGMDV